jgi:hypothetical protein
MVTKRVISNRNLPRQIPWKFICILILFLKEFNAPGWAWGAGGTIALISLGVWLVDVVQFHEQEVNIFKQDANRNNTFRREEIPEIPE